MTDADVYAVLMEIREDIGAIKTSTTTTKDWLTQHVADDKILTERVRSLETESAMHRGGIKVWSMFGALVGSAVGAVAGYFGLNR